MTKMKHSKGCKCHTGKIQYALWKRPKELHGDEFLIDALEMQILSSEMRRMNEQNTNDTKITVIPFEEDSYESYILKGEYWCFFSEDDQLELFQKNSNGVMICFITHEHLYEVGLNSMRQLTEAHRNHFDIEAEASINKVAYDRIIKLMKDNVEHCITLFGRVDQDPLTNLLNRQWLLKIKSIGKKY